MQCKYEGCGWRAIAPSNRAAREQYARHVVEEHAGEVDAEVPDGMVEVRTDDGEWELMTFEEAGKYGRERHADD